MNNWPQMQKKRNRIVHVIGNRRITAPTLRLAIFRALSSVPRNLRGQAKKRDLLVSHQRKFVFIKIPLVASQSVDAAIQLASDQSGFDLQRVAGPLAGVPQQLKGYFWFAFVRNPWARCVSCFHKKVLNADSLGKLLLISRHRGLDFRMTFAAFVDFLCSEQGADAAADLHWISQHKVTCDTTGQRVCKNVYQLEDLKGCMDVFEYATGVRFDTFPKIGSSTTMNVLPAHSNFREWYTPETWEKVYDRYRSDCVAFGYDSNAAESPLESTELLNAY